MLGALILGQSLWALAQPVNPALLRFGLVFFLCGVWNIFLVFRGGFQGSNFLVGILGVAQIRWAYRFYQTYRRNILMALVAPTPETTARYREICKVITSEKVQDNDLFLMQLRGGWWNCLLLAEVAILAPQKGRFFILADKNEVIIEAKRPSGRQFMVLVKLAAKTLGGKIQRDGYDKYVLWKGEAKPVSLPD
ncbi:MAG TPA: hypothetical protein VHO69_17365 [Phototrophicaceae bacterium]|nr:hypothetical protein [Phototrophicaceae bacterium]